MVITILTLLLTRFKHNKQNKVKRQRWRIQRRYQVKRQRSERNRITKLGGSSVTSRSPESRARAYFLFFLFACCVRFSVCCLFSHALTRGCGTSQAMFI